MSDWSSDVCSSNLILYAIERQKPAIFLGRLIQRVLGIKDLFRHVREHALVPQFRRLEIKIRALHDAHPHFKLLGECLHARSEERRVGKEWGSTGRFRGSPYHYKKT